VRVDDFARKIIGDIDKVEMPESGANVEKGQQLFSVVQGDRTVPFQSPVSGKVITCNEDLAKNARRLQNTSYNDNWICLIGGRNLEPDLKDLKIGQGAVDFYGEEIKRIEAFVSGESSAADADARTPMVGELYLGVLGKLKDEQFKKTVRDIFGGS
jgi:glycine cleavage system H lipoate-binding protein